MTRCSTCRRSLAVLAAILAFALAFLPSADLSAQVRTDATLGRPAQSLVGPNYVIGESLGRLAGSNLFHSFETFNVVAGQSATFTTSTVGITNVISRVTGGSLSQIDGLLRLSAASGTPGFLFINPAGVTFGPNARVDVPGTFSIATANFVKFPDGNFYADPARSSSFSSAAPEAFGFLGGNTGAMDIDGARLTGSRALFGGGDALFVGSHVTVENSQVEVLGGRIRIVATGSAATELPLAGPVPGDMNGSMTIAGSRIETTASGAGTIELSGGNIIVRQSSDLWADNSGPADAAGDRGVRILAEDLTVSDASSVTSDALSSGRSGSIGVEARGTLSVLSGARIATTVADNVSGNAGDVSVSAVQITLDGTGSTQNQGIFSRANPGSTGGAGNVLVTSGSALTLENGSQISSVTHGAGNGGTVTVRAADALIDGHGGTSTGIFAHAAAGSGDAGAVEVAIPGTLTLRAGGKISSDTLSAGDAASINIAATAIVIDGVNDPTASAGISSSAVTGATGAVGGIRVSAGDSLTIRDAGRIFSAARGSGNAGILDIRATGNVRVDHGGQIFSSTWGAGDAGTVAVQAGAITLDSMGLTGIATGIFSNSEASATGNAGGVGVSAAGNIAALGGSQIASSTFGAGRAGTVSVSGANLMLDASGNPVSAGGIFSSANPGATGDAGTVGVTITGTLALRDGGEISTATLGAGSAGTVSVAAGSIDIDGSGGSPFVTGIFSEAQAGSGNAGQVSVNAGGSLALRSGGVISSSTRTAGAAGTINVDAGAISIDGSSASGPSGIRAIAFAGSGGQAGTLSVSARDSLALSGGGILSIRNEATVATPAALSLTRLDVTSPRITLKDASISAAATGNIPASSINIRFSDLLHLDPSSISTSANLGNGGAISILGGRLVWLDNSQITTSVTGLTGNGGDISLRTDTLVLTTGFIQANTAASNASGGNVLIDANALFASGNMVLVGGNVIRTFQPYAFGYNVIQAAAPDGVSGDVNVTAPVLDVSASLVGLVAKVLDSGGVARSPCAATAGSGFSVTGRGGLPPLAGGLLRPEIAPANFTLRRTPFSLVELPSSPAPCPAS